MVVSSVLILIEKAFRLGVAFLLNAFIIRHLGPQDYGIWAYALALVAIFSILPSLDFSSLLIRDLAAYPERQSALMGTATAVRFVGAIIGFVCIAVVLFGSGLRNPKVELVTFLVALTFVFQPFEIFESYLIARARVGPIVLARFCSFVICSFLKLAALLAKEGVVVFALVSLVEPFAFALTLGWVYRFGESQRFNWRVDLKLARKLLKEAAPVIAGSLSVMVYMRLGQVMLARMVGEEEVGFYAVAVKVSEVWYFIPTSLAGIMIHRFTKLRGQDLSAIVDEVGRFISVFFWTSITLSVAVTLLSPVLIPLVFGEKFRASVGPAQIFSWTLTASFISVVFAQYLVSCARQRIIFISTAFGLVLNALLNLILIPRFASVGASVSALMTYNAVTLGYAILQRPKGINFGTLLAYLSPHHAFNNFQFIYRKTIRARV